MKLDKHTLTEKKYYVAIKQLDALHEKMRNLPYRKLDEPYQDGWKLTLILRDDISRSPKAPVLQYILDKYSNTFYVKNPKLISQIRKNPTIEQLHKLYVNKHHYGLDLGIKDITEKEYKELPDTHKKYFSLISNFMSKTRYGGRIMYECNIPNFYFKVKTDKRMIKQVQDIDPVLKKQEAELKKLLAPYWRTTSYGMGYYHYFENRKERRKSKVDVAKMTMED